MFNQKENDLEIENRKLKDENQALNRIINTQQRLIKNYATRKEEYQLLMIKNAKTFNQKIKEINNQIAENNLEEEEEDSV